MPISPDEGVKVMKEGKGSELERPIDSVWVSKRSKSV
jgi:hypothetical protein